MMKINKGNVRCSLMCKRDEDKKIIYYYADSNGIYQEFRKIDKVVIFLQKLQKNIDYTGQ